MRPLAVVGNVNVDLVMGPFDPWPAPGTEVIADMDELRPGGAAGNVALAWQALGVAHQVAASTGDDVFAGFLRHAFPESERTWPRAKSATTLSVGITHPDGERTFFTTHGHLAALTVDQVKVSLDVGKLRGGILLLCGSFLMPGLTGAYGDLFDWAETHDIDIALDTGWPPGGWTDETIGMVRGWLPHCRHLLLNEAEATALTRSADGLDAARTLTDILPQDGTVVVKRGPEGAASMTNAGEDVLVPGRRIDVIDTIGAGDVFNAGYLVAIARGLPLADALELGVEMASTAISTEPRRYTATVDGLEGTNG